MTLNYKKNYGAKFLEENGKTLFNARKIVPKLNNYLIYKNKKQRLGFPFNISSILQKSSSEDRSSRLENVEKLKNYKKNKYGDKQKLSKRKSILKSEINNSDLLRHGSKYLKNRHELKNPLLDILHRKKPKIIDPEWQSDDPGLPICAKPQTAVPDKTIDIAVLVPTEPPDHFTPCSRERVMPAVQLAVEHLYEMELHGPLKEWNVKIHYMDTNCSSTYGPLAAVDLHFQSKADVFLGPVCEYALAPVCRFASVWDTPVLTPGGHPHAFDFKENFPSLTRLRGFDTEVSRVFKSIADHYNWEVIGLLYEDKADSEGHSACHLTLSGVHDAFNKTSENRGFVQGVDDLKDVIMYFFNKARIIVLCAQNSSIVRDIMIMAYDLGMTGGDFAFFNIELFSGILENYQPWFDPKDTSDRNRKAREAFSALLTITARVPDNPTYKKFVNETLRIAEEQFNSTYPTEEPHVSPYVASFYEAVIVYARALNETLKNNRSISNGTDIIYNLWNHTFTDLITGNVSINGNGDRNADYSILDLDENDKFGNFQVSDHLGLKI
ncbi:UNVERIFIED_CONTAM: hypothetical protein RMT77_015503 [Armadillidium vulgare]